MIFREATVDECRKSEEHCGFDYFCPVCKENTYSDNCNDMPFACDHCVFLFQAAKGCYDCDIAVLHGLKPIDKTKSCSCWHFPGEERYDILQNATKVKSLMEGKKFPSIVEYYRCFFELIGDIGVDEIIYRYIIMDRTCG